MNDTKLKVCLVNPGYNMQGLKAYRIPLGLAYVAGLIKSRGYTITGYNFDVDPYEEFLQVIPDFDIFGIYASTAIFKFASKIAKDVKERNPHAKIIIGGPYASSEPVQLLERLPEADIASFGDGEYTFADTVDALAVQQDLANVLGIAWRAGASGIVRNNPRPRIMDLDALPFPAKEVFDHGHYKPRWFAYGAMIASRGCPFRCTICQPILNNLSQYRVRKPKFVVDEMEYFHKNFGVNHFCFEDSELLISKAWALNFSEEVINRKLKVTFEGNARLHQLDDEVLQKIAKAGCVKMNTGIESASQRVLNILKKDIILEKDLPRFNKIKQYGMDAHAWIIIGIPGETMEEILETIKMTVNLNATTVEINIATPWSGTELETYGREQGWISTANLDELNEKSTSYFKTPYLTPEQVQEAYKTFLDELKKYGWVKWSHDANTYYKRPSLKIVLIHAIRKLKRFDIRKEDFSILIDWLKLKTIPLGNLQPWNPTKFSTV